MTSQLLREICDIPAVVERQLHECGAQYRDIGRDLARSRFTVAITNARGTSDHAATYFKYLMELRRGVPVASVGPSIASVYQRPLALNGQLCLTISQSGASRDLVMLQETARAAGARTLALVNDMTSPVATGAELAVPLGAGPERAVAATKTYVASLVAIAAIIAGMDEDAALSRALERLPEALAAALEADWSTPFAGLAELETLFTISRGPGLSLAAEAALKLKETSGLHAEAYSAAEVRHGPIALAATRRIGAVVFALRDEGRASILDADSALRASHARVLLADPNGGGDLPAVPTPHPVLDPICQAVSFYRMLVAFARLRGFDPDRPANISKITNTL